MTKPAADSRLQFTAAASRLLASLPADGTAVKARNGGQLAAAKALVAAGVAKVEGSMISVVAKPEPAKKAPKARPMNVRLAAMTAEQPTKVEVTEAVTKTTKTTKKAKAPKAKKEKAPSRAWPSAFLTRAQIADRLESDAAFRIEALKIMGDRTEARQADPELRSCGFMSSHLVTGMRMVEIVRDGRELTGEQWFWTSTALSYYPRQLAAHFRAQACLADPSLAKLAAVYGVAPKAVSK